MPRFNIMQGGMASGGYGLTLADESGKSRCLQAKQAEGVEEPSPSRYGSDIRAYQKLGLGIRTLFKDKDGGRAHHAF